MHNQQSATGSQLPRECDHNISEAANEKPGLSRYAVPPSTTKTLEKQTPYCHHYCNPHTQLHTDILMPLRSCSLQQGTRIRNEIVHMHSCSLAR
jgi:hypothetical protein